MRCMYIACMKIHDMKTESPTLVGTVDLNIRRVRKMFCDIQISLKLHANHLRPTFTGQRVNVNGLRVV